MPAFVLHEYTPLIDSADMAPDDWCRIADDIAAQYDQYDGFVVLHGTDTMAFTASALAFMLEGLTKPVIVTGSQIPMADLRSDGASNILNSLYLAAYYPIHEVGLLFHNCLYRGCRATKAHADHFDAFESPNFPPLVSVGINIKLGQGEVKPVKWFQNPLVVSKVLKQPIAVITLYPGIDVELLSGWTKGAKAVILRSFGLGNAPQSPRLLELIKALNKRGVIVVNITQCFKGSVEMGGYMGGCALLEAGVIGGGDMTLEAAVGKLHYLLSKDIPVERVKLLIGQSLRGEITEHPMIYRTDSQRSF
eukprot:Selendium_serpulae@DN2452_c0_g1_i1.p1